MNIDDFEDDGWNRRGLSDSWDDMDEALYSRPTVAVAASAESVIDLSINHQSKQVSDRVETSRVIQLDDGNIMPDYMGFQSRDVSAPVPVSGDDFDGDLELDVDDNDPWLRGIMSRVKTSMTSQSMDDVARDVHVGPNASSSLYRPGPPIQSTEKVYAEFLKKVELKRKDLRAAAVMKDIRDKEKQVLYAQLTAVSNELRVARDSLNQLEMDIID